MAVKLNFARMTSVTQTRTLVSDTIRLMFYLLFRPLKKFGGQILCRLHKIQYSET